MHETRRGILALSAAGLSAGPAFAARDDGDEQVKLWPGVPPGGEGVTVQDAVTERALSWGKRNRLANAVATPTLTIFRPQRANGAALLVIPGGGYGVVAVDVEGMESGERWSSLGWTVFVLRYRLPSAGWRDKAETPLQDAQRAIRWIRGNAARFAIDANRVAVMGFSAGGHLAGSLASRHLEQTYPAIDAVDAQPARPDLAVLVYPVVTMRAFGHAGSRLNLLGPSPTPEQVTRYSLESAPPAGSPPTLLIHAADDRSVSVQNSLALFSALQAAAIPSELHVFEEGGHGFGLRGVADKTAAAWPGLVDAFAKRHGIV